MSLSSLLSTLRYGGQIYCSVRDRCQRTSGNIYAWYVLDSFKADITCGNEGYQGPDFNV